MTDFLRIFATILLAANPLLIAAAIGWRPSIITAFQSAVVAGAMLAGVALVSESLLDSLSIEPETFRIGAGAIMMVAGATALFLPRPRPIPAPSGPGGFVLVPVIFPLAWPNLASAGGVVAAMNYAANGELSATLASIAAAMILSAVVIVLVGGRWRIPALSVGRICGAALIVLAVDLIVSGVKVV